MVDVGGEIVLVNRETERMFGYAREELLGQPIECLIPKRLHERHVGLRGDYFADPSARALGVGRDLFALRKDGTEFPVEIGLNPVVSDSGMYVLAFIADIRVRKQAEQTLRDSELRFRQLAENMREVFFLVDAQFRETLYISPAYEDIWGRSRQTLYDNPRSFVETVPVEDQGRLFTNIAQAQEGRTPDDIEFRVVRPDGTTRWVLARAVPVRNERDEVYRIAGVVSDVTERKRAEETLAQRARLAELNANIGAALTHGETLRDILQSCAEALVRHLDAAFARVWTVNDQTNTLELQASAGLYTHLDGPHSRVPIGQFKIGLIAQERRPHLTNAVIGDPRVHDQEWATREGMVAFAGYPLIVADRVVGVLAMFARHPFSDYVQEALSSIADGVAVGIERTRGREALRASERRMRNLFETVNLIVLALDAGGRIEYVNPYFLGLTGYGAEEVIGRDWFEFLPAVQQETLQGAFRELLERDRHPHYRYPIVTKQGHERIIAWHNTVLRDANGRRTGTLSIGEDITEHEHAAEVIRQLSQAVEQSPAGVVITDTTGTIRYVNSKATELTGYASAEVIGKNPRIFKSNTTPPGVHRELWKTITAGEEWRGVLENRRKDGRLWWNAATISPMRDAAGRVTHFLAIQQDVTEQRLLEDQFRQAQKMEAVGRLAGGVAHDFNNLLTVITSYSELLLGDLSAEDPRRGDLEEIRKAAGAAAALTRQLLAFSRKQVLEPTVLDLNAVLAGAEKMLKRLIGEDIDLATVPAPGLGAVRADAGQVEQVIMNLAVNARDAMPEGGKLTIETANVVLDASYTNQHRAVGAGAYVLLSISDTGTGMDEQTKAHAFEPFFTTKEQGKGTGLGLATVYGIIKQSGGFIWVYSELGRGTTFKMYFPRVEDAASIPAAPPALKSLRGTETVLVAEDAAAVRAVVQQVLTHHGYQVLEAADGRSALELGTRHDGPVHLLVTDVVMPEMSGRQLVDRLQERRPTLKVLFVSGYTDDAITRHGILEPGIAFLQKPFTPESLARKVREVLDA